MNKCKHCGQSESAHSYENKNCPVVDEFQETVFESEETEMIEFCNRVVDKSVVSFEQFKELLLTYKPKEIWCNYWSSKMPFIEIVEYLNENEILCFYKSESICDPIPSITTIEELYKRHRYGGLVDSYFVVDKSE